MTAGGYTPDPIRTADGRARPWIPVAVWAVLILVLSLAPPGSVAPFVLDGLDRAVHAVLYGVLAVLVARALEARGVGETAVALVVALAFGGVVEWLQEFVGRTPDAVDWLADGAGALLGLVVRGGRIRLTERSR